MSGSSRKMSIVREDGSVLRWVCGGMISRWRILRRLSGIHAPTKDCFDVETLWIQVANSQRCQGCFQMVRL
jgi:hypothetical protein